VIRALVTLRLVCDRCGAITNVEPLPDADAVTLDCWQAAIEDQALDLYSHASRNLASCAQCVARSVKLSITPAELAHSLPSLTVPFTHCYACESDDLTAAHVCGHWP
jgi:hypothetical protein